MGIIVNSKRRKTTARTSRTMKLRLVTSYAGAYARGNTLLYLPRKLRERIYTSTLTDTESKAPCFEDIEVPDTADLTLPEPCAVGNVFRREITELLLENATVTIPSDAAIYNLRLFLNDIDDGNGFNLVRSISFTSLDVFEKGEFTANAASLVKKMNSLERVTVMIDLRKVPFSENPNDEAAGAKAMDVELFAATWDIEGLLTAKSLQTIVLTLQPYLALRKKVHELAGENGAVGVEDGLSEFWGLKQWIERKAEQRGRVVEVCCPGPEVLVSV